MSNAKTSFGLPIVAAPLAGLLFSGLAIGVLTAIPVHSHENVPSSISVQHSDHSLSFNE